MQFKGSFFFEVQTESKDKGPFSIIMRSKKIVNKQHSFKSIQAELICDMIHDWLDELERLEMEGSEPKDKKRRNKIEDQKKLENV